MQSSVVPSRPNKVFCVGYGTRVSKQTAGSASSSVAAVAFYMCCSECSEEAGVVVQDFIKFLWDDAAMLSSSRAHWTLVPAAEANTSAQQNSDSIDATQNGKRHTYGLRIAYPEQAKEICSKGLVVGSCPQADIRLESNQVPKLPLSVPIMTCRWRVGMDSALHATLKGKSLLWLLW